MEEKDKRIAKLEALLVKALERIAVLERMLGQNSENSSKPPSSNGLRKKPTPQSLRSKGGKPTGGQKGHKEYTLEQHSKPTAVVKHSFTTCSSCGHSLTQEPATRVINGQVFDIPDPQAHITEHQADVKVCSCGHQNMTSFPKDVRAPVQYGLRVKTLAVYLSNQQMLPEDRLQQTFEDVFSLPLSKGTLAKINVDFAKKYLLCRRQF
jgi:transposase